ncbi:MAG: cupin domain-containing protein [Gammaproteobacteria bacterium]
MTAPIVSIDKVQPVPRPAGFRPAGTTADRFDASTARLSQALGLTKLGVNVTAVAPGKSAYPFHSHRNNDELFLVLAGQGELRLGAARHPVGPGDLIGCPAGDATTAHQLVNTGKSELRYLAISTALDPEICEYPDSGKVGAYAGDGPAGMYHMTRLRDRADYWDDE